MKFNGLIKFLTIVLIFVSIYQLHFTWVIDNFEDKILEQAEKISSTRFNDSMSDVEKSNLIKQQYRALLDSSKNEVITYGLTGEVTYLQAKDQELNLGLDLQGGMNVTLEIGIDALIKGLSNNPNDILLNQALQLANDKKYSSSEDYITLFYNEYKSVSNGAKLSNLFSNSQVLKNNVTANTSDDEIINIIREETIEAEKRTYNILQTRIDKFGVAQPSVNLDLDKSIITVELAGVQDNPERVRKYLQSTANLQFWEVFDIESTYPFLIESKETIDNLNNSSDSSDKQKKGKDNETFTSIDDFLENNTDATSDISSEDNSAKAPQYNAFDEVLSQVQYFSQQASQNQIPLSKTPLSFSIPDNKLNQFYSQVQSDYIKGILPSNLLFLPEKKDSKQETDYTIFHAIRTQEFSDKARLEGESIATAYQDYDDRGRPCIRMSMTKTGEKIWGDMTTQNVGMPIAISLDDIVYSAPRVNTPIVGGNSEISGSFSIQEAQDLSNILKSGKLPAPTKIVLEQLVGPTLGSETIKGGITAFIISFIIILALMFAYYSSGGTIANISLLLNILFTIGILTALGATLTAPGIAGLVLTIGMAVDTNVIIFERIKEEIRKGASYVNAIKNGYSKSLSPVLDAHVTTLLTAIILYNFGLGPVKGFATTQILGILLSLFCGILVSKQISDIWTNRKRHFNYFTSISKKIFPSPQYKFIEFRKYAYIISIAIFGFGIASFFHGFDLGVEFKGGRTYVVKFNEVPSIKEYRGLLKNSLEGENPIIKTIGNDRQLSITTAYLIDNDSKVADDKVLSKIYQASTSFLPSQTTEASFINYNLVGFQKVLPTISEELKRGALNATILSLVLVFLYILIRFRKWQYSIGTIVALFHDVFVCLIIFSFFRKIVPFALEIDQHFIAAILTVIGFSMNDTVIVFDRIREYFRENKSLSQKDVINKAINSTLSRTVMTSITVFLTILILFIFGGEVTRGFAFAMLIGIITGTYSSVFVAAPILMDFSKLKKTK